MTSTEGGPPTVITGDERRRNPWNIVLGVVFVALLIGAGVGLLRSRSASDDASNARADAATLDDQRTELSQQADEDVARATDLDVAMAAVRTSLQAYDDAVSAQSASHNHQVDVQNEAVTLYNQGKVAAAKELDRTKVTDAAADLQATTVAVDQALADARAKVSALEELTHG